MRVDTAEQRSSADEVLCMVESASSQLAHPKAFCLKRKPELQLVGGQGHEVAGGIMGGGGIQPHSPCLGQSSPKLIGDAEGPCLLLQLLQFIIQLLCQTQPA